MKIIHFFYILIAVFLFSCGQASSDASQANYVDGIWEQRYMTNPNTGQQYKVEGYNNQVWMNQNNEYI